MLLGTYIHFSQTVDVAASKSSGLTSTFFCKTLVGTLTVCEEKLYGYNYLKTVMPLINHPIIGQKTLIGGGQAVSLERNSFAVKI